MSGADGEGDAQLMGINHVALEVGDLEEALEFYRGLFRFELRGRTDSAAFLDMGDQFLALSESGGGAVDHHRHVGLVVSDAGAVERRAEERGVERLETRGLDLRDPWGNRLQVVDYREVQFTKAGHVLRGMGLAGLEKTEGAREELREKGLGPG